MQGHWCQRMLTVQHRVYCQQVGGLGWRIREDTQWYQSFQWQCWWHCVTREILLDFRFLRHNALSPVTRIRMRSGQPTRVLQGPKVPTGQDTFIAIKSWSTNDWSSTLTSVCMTSDRGCVCVRPRHHWTTFPLVCCCTLGSILESTAVQALQGEQLGLNFEAKNVCQNAKTCTV